MALSVGIVGMPNVGKSTLLNALTRAGAEAANYPFCTIDKNVGVVEVHDDKLLQLSEALNPEETVPSTIEVVDIAGLVKGASKGEGLGNRFLGHIREVDAIAHVVRCFEDPDIVHVYGDIDPLRDIGVVDAELAIADLDSAARTLERDRKVHTDESRRRVAVLEAIVDGLERGLPIRDLGLPDDDLAVVRDHSFLTAKPMLYVANVGDSDLSEPNPHVEAIRCKYGDDRVFVVSARIEAELAELDPPDRREMMSALGLLPMSPDLLVRKLFGMLGLISFYTIANDKLRAWKLKVGTTAPKAAGMIHSDMERGFIRAEIARFEDVIVHRSFSELRKHGLVRSEGKEYQIQAEDVVHFLFSS